MPEKKTIERARQDAREGKAPSTQAGEFVREEIEHVREAKHGARSTKQAIAIGLSKARRAGVKLPPPKKASARTRTQAARDTAKGQSPERPVSADAIAGGPKRPQKGRTAGGNANRSLPSGACQLQKPGRRQPKPRSPESSQDPGGGQGIARFSTKAVALSNVCNEVAS